MKKTLVIDPRVFSSEFALDPLWAGLVDKFGAENVIDYPPAPKHREGIPRITGNPEADYGAERRTLCYTGKQFPEHTLFEVNDMLAHGEIERIFLDERDQSCAIYMQTMACFFNVPVVVVSGLDTFENDSPKTLQRWYGKNLEAMFLDNWRPEFDLYPNAFPMNNCVNFDHMWDIAHREDLLKDKIYDVSFMGYNSHPDREFYFDHLVEKYGTKGNFLFLEKRHNISDDFIMKKEYFRVIAQSKVCVNLRGSADCGKALRLYEIPYVGSAMVSQAYPVKQIHPFIDAEHCLYFKSICSMDFSIDLLLAYSKEREEMARAGHEHAMKYHTARARVDYVYECLEAS